MNSNTISTN